MPTTVHSLLLLGTSPQEPINFRLPPTHSDFKEKCKELVKHIGGPRLSLELNLMHDAFGDIYCTSGLLGYRVAKKSHQQKTALGTSEEQMKDSAMLSGIAAVSSDKVLHKGSTAAVSSGKGNRRARASS